MAVTDFVVAIELGSTKITGMAGRKNADGSIYILAKEEEHSVDCIKKGAIYNLDKTTQALTNIIQRLEDDLHASIKKAYVGISGKSLRSFVNNEKREFSEETKVSQALIDSIMQSNKNFPLVDMELLHVEPQEYKIGNNLLTEPVGVNTEAIEASFVNVVARPSLKENIIQCFRHSGCDIAEILIAPIEAAKATLTDSERRSGCALVDIGTDTTTVSVYKNNILRHIAVIPLGGSNITKDICSLQIEDINDAEAIKLQFASAYTEESEDPDYADKKYSLNDNLSIQAIKLEDVVESRVYEIISNIWNQITISGYADKLMAGVVITGGSANMPNMEAAFTRITKIEKVRIAKESLIQTAGVEVKKDATSNTIIGLIAACKENCSRIDPNMGHTIPFIIDSENEGTATEEAGQTDATTEDPATIELAPAETEGEESVVSSKDEPAQSETEDNKEADPGQETEKTTPELTEEEQKKEEIRKKDECQVYINKASHFIVTRRYEEALVEIENARQYDIPNKKTELDALENEAKRLKSEAETVLRIRIKKQKEEAEKLRRQKEECERLIEEINELIESKELKEAEEKIKEALEIGIPEYTEDLNELLNKTKTEPKKKSWFNKAWKKIVNGADEIMKDN